MVELASEDFERLIIRPDLSVNSGVYAAISPSVAMRLGARGEYEYYSPDGEWYSDSAEDLLAVSAFGGVGAREDAIADELFPVAAGATVDPVIGNYHGLYAGHAIEGTFREEGSSGGITSWLLAELLRTGRIDGVIHMVPTPGEDTLFAYQISTDEDDIARGSKSRYYPGHLADVLREVSQGSKRYALTAIPSFAYEIRLLQRLRPEFFDRIPFILGLLCGHQKTANYARQLGWRVGIAPGEIAEIDFRKKDPSRPASQYVMEVRGVRQGKETVQYIRQGSTYETDWGLGLFKSNFSDFTEDAFNETADVALGDAWLPNYVTDSRGTNVVIARNRELNALLLAAREAGRLHLEDLTEGQVLASQSALVKHSVLEVRERFRILAARGEYTPPPRRADVSSRVGFLRKRLQATRTDLSRLSHTAWIEAVAADDIAVFDERLAGALGRYRLIQRLIHLPSLPRRVASKITRRLRR